ncbi:unnamed protein product [Prunus brigantina]
MIQLLFGITNTSNIYKFWHAGGIPNSQNVSGNKGNQGPGGQVELDINGQAGLSSGRDVSGV